MQKPSGRHFSRSEGSTRASGGEREAPAGPVWVRSRNAGAQRYRLLGPLGRGGMGHVYFGETEDTGARVAIKVLHPSDALDAREARLRFLREAEILTQLRHPNIVQILDFSEGDDGTLFLVMQLVPGQSMRDILLVEGQLAEPRLVSVSRQIGDALGEAHRHGIVHRDLKPSNAHLFVDREGWERVIVLDFGVGKQLDEDPSEQLTGLGKYIGSMPYSSPEQLLTAPLDVRSDIYSLGVFMFEMATGLVPFASTSPMDLIDMHLHREVPGLREIFPGCRISTATEAVIRRCLAKSPDDRWQSADELIAALAAVMPT